MPKIRSKYYQRAKESTNSIISFIESVHRFPQESSASASNKETDASTSTAAATLLGEPNVEEFTEELNVNTAVVNCDDDDEFHDFYLNQSNSDSDCNNNNIINKNDSPDQVKSTEGSDLDTSVDEDEMEYAESFTSKLVTWALRNKISHSAMNELLRILKPKHSELPTDARILLKSPRDKKILRVVEPGYYYHFGLQKCIEKLCSKHELKNVRTIEIYVNIDGLPLFKSSNKQVWPILCSLAINREIVDMIGIYYGSKKPEDANGYLQDFINDTVRLCTDGIIINDVTYSFKIKAFICDTPAKAFIKCTKGHAGFYSCPKCTIEGEYINGRVCFPNSSKCRARTDADFRVKLNTEHHLRSQSTNLTLIPKLDIISDFVSDPMHLIDLGVTKTLLVRMWCDGKPKTKLSYYQLSEINKLLCNQIKNIPCEFNRKPRSLDECKRWKATEFRQFLLYTGPAVLKTVLCSEKYLNFLVLHVAVTILSSHKHSNYLNYADALLHYFVKTFIILYGKENCSPNIHSLLHLCDDVKKFGILQEFSAYPFENYMQKIKGYIRKYDKPLEQIINRKYEEDIIRCDTKININIKPRLENDHNNGPLLIDQVCINQWKTLKYHNFTLRTKEPNNCCSLRDSSIIIIRNFVSYDNDNDVIKSVVIGHKFESLHKFYTEPCDSSLFGIHLVDYTMGPLQSWNISDISYKCIKLNFKDKFVIYPLLHTS